MRKRRDAWFSANGPCLFCQSWKDLELDHIEPANKVHHAVWSWSNERRAAELAKCCVLCRKCHDLRHGASHGSSQMYDRYKCRCHECVKANTEKCNRFRESLVARGLKRKA